MSAIITLDEDTHTYRADGVIVPSVTQILSDISTFKRMDPAWLVEAAYRGRMIHRCIELYNKGQLDEDDLDLVYRPYLTAWKRFCHDTKFVALHTETIIHSERWGYAGMCDEIGTWQSLRRRTMVTIDVKSGAKDPAHGPQTAAYAEPLRDMGLLEGKHTQRCVVRVQADGFYGIDHFKDHADWPIFLACLTTHKFKVKHGLL